MSESMMYRCQAAWKAAWLLSGVGGTFAASSAAASGSNTYMRCSASLFKDSSSVILARSLLDDWPIGLQQHEKRSSLKVLQQGSQRQAPAEGSKAS